MNVPVEDRAAPEPHRVRVIHRLETISPVTGVAAGRRVSLRLGALLDNVLRDATTRVWQQLRPAYNCRPWRCRLVQGRRCRGGTCRKHAFPPEHFLFVPSLSGQTDRFQHFATKLQSRLTKGVFRTLADGAADVHQCDGRCPHRNRDAGADGVDLAREAGGKAQLGSVSHCGELRKNGPTFEFNCVLLSVLSLS